VRIGTVNEPGAIPFGSVVRRTHKCLSRTNS
jgi:hypothetical protein